MPYGMNDISASTVPFPTFDTAPLGSEDDDIGVPFHLRCCRAEEFAASPLPDTASRSQPRDNGEPVTPSQQVLRPNGLLVIEDDRLLRKALGEAFRDHGFDLWTAENGSVGVELFRQFWPLIDIVLCDVQMPELDGPQTLDALRAINPSVRFCFMTGDARGAIRTRLLSRGALRVYEKPFPSVANVAWELWELATRVEMQMPANDSSIEEPPAPHTSSTTPHFPEITTGGRLLKRVVNRILASMSCVASTLRLRKPRSNVLSAPPT